MKDDVLIINKEIASVFSIQMSSQLRVYIAFSCNENELACGVALSKLNLEVSAIPLNRAVFVQRNPETGRKDELAKKITDLCALSPSHLILVGSFFTVGSPLLEIVDQFPAVTFVVIQGNDETVPSETKSNLEFLFISKDTIGPNAAMCAYMQTLFPAREFLIGAIVAANAEIIRLMDARRFGKDIGESGTYLTGLMNHPSIPADTSLVEAFMLMFNGTIKAEEVRSIGRTIVEAQQKLAMERAKNNSRDGTFVAPNGVEKKVAITCADNLVELTHGALAREHPGVDVTITTALRFRKGTSLYTVSIRSKDEQVDARELARTMGGGGGGTSSNVAGGEVEVGLDSIPFLSTFKDSE